MLVIMSAPPMAPAKRFSPLGYICTNMLSLDANAFR
jgi:hypothetical protein